MKKAASVLFATLTFFTTYSQNADTTYWQIGGRTAVTFSQVSLTNWAAGGQNSAAINFNHFLFADYNKGRTKWENFLDLGYGLIKQGEGDLDKSDDKINLVTKYGYQINKDNEKWFFSGLLDFRTQFDEGFDAETDQIVISDFMAPGYLVVGTGVDYYPNEYLSLSYIPVTGKFTFVTIQDLADQGAFGVDAAVRDSLDNIITPGKNSRAELGSFFRARYLRGNFESRLEMFTNYIDNVGNIDVNWQNALTVKVTKAISTNFFTQLLYDDDIKIADEEGVSKPRLQFKSVIGVGLSYQFGATKE